MKLPNSTFTNKFNKQHGRCYYCGCLLNDSKIEIDHKIAFSKGRDGTNENLCLTCSDCNRKKSDKYIHEFKDFVSINCPDKLIRGMFYFEFINI